MSAVQYEKNSKSGKGTYQEIATNHCRLCRLWMSTAFSSPNVRPRRFSFKVFKVFLKYYKVYGCLIFQSPSKPLLGCHAIYTLGKQRGGLVSATSPCDSSLQLVPATSRGDKSHRVNWSFFFKIQSQGPTLVRATSPTNSNQFEFLGPKSLRVVPQRASCELFVGQVPTTSSLM